MLYVQNQPVGLITAVRIARASFDNGTGRSWANHHDIAQPPAPHFRNEVRVVRPDPGACEGLTRDLIPERQAMRSIHPSCRKPFDLVHLAFALHVPRW